MTFTHQRIDLFEKIAPFYDLLIGISTFGGYSKFLKKGVAILCPEKGERILDLCSGTGRAAFWISQAAGKEGEVTGIDLARSMIVVSRRRYPGPKNLRFIQKDATREWEYENYFDGIFTSFSIHELPEKYRVGVFERSYSALKGRGRMVIADFNPHVSGVARMVSLAFFKLFEKRNLKFLDFDQNKILREVGFRKIKTFPVMGGILQITLARKGSD